MQDGEERLGHGVTVIRVSDRAHRAELKLAVDQVVAGGGVGVAAGAATASFVDPDDAHQPFDPLAADSPTLTEHQLVMDPRRAIRASGRMVDLTDPLDQLGVGDQASAGMRLGVTPRVERRRRHAEGAAPHSDRVVGLLPLDQLKDQLGR